MQRRILIIAALVLVTFAPNAQANMAAIPASTFAAPSAPRVDTSAETLPLVRGERRFLPLTPAQMSRVNFRKVQLENALPRRPQVAEALPSQGGAVDASGMTLDQAKQILSIFGGAQ